MANVSSTANETSILPIDNFWEQDISFDVASLRLTADQIRFFFGTTNGRPNFQYFLFILATMTFDREKEMIRGLEVKTTTCERQLSVSSLDTLWGMKRKQARNLLDKMEQLKLIRRTSNNVTSVVNISCVWGVWKNGYKLENNQHEQLYRSVPLAHTQASTIDKVIGNSGNNVTRTAISSSNEAAAFNTASITDANKTNVAPSPQQSQILVAETTGAADKPSLPSDDEQKA